MVGEVWVRLIFLLCRVSLSILLLKGYVQNIKNKLLLLFSCWVVSDSLWPHELQHTRLPLSFPISWSLLRFMSVELVVLSNHLILCAPFSFHLQSFPASGSFPMNWLFASCGQSSEASASVLLMNIQGWLPPSIKWHLLTFFSLWGYSAGSWGYKKERCYIYLQETDQTIWYIECSSEVLCGFLLEHGEDVLKSDWT